MASILLGAAGAGIGSIFGSPMLGLSVGVSLAGILFPARIPAQERGKLDDLRVTGSGYGAFITQIYGTARVGGNVIWSTDLQEHVSTTSQGGKGMGGSQTVKNYSYTVSCAVLVCRGPIAAITKIQAEDKVIYDSTATPPTKYTIRIYLGDETQVADSLMVSALSPDPCPAYRGSAYVVFENLDLTPWGNRMPSMTFNVEEASTTVGAVLANIADQAGLVAGDDYDFSDAADAFPTNGGVVISQRTAAKSQVEDLLRAYATDLTEIDGRLIAAKRGTLVTTDIDPAHLGARVWSGKSDNPPPSLTTKRLQDLEIATRVDINYFSPSRNYQNATQEAIYYTKPNVQDAMTVQTPLILDDDTARQIATRILYTQWLERETFNFPVPPAYLLLAPASVVNLPVNGVPVRARIIGMDIGLFGELQMTGVPDEDGSGAGSVLSQPQAVGVTTPTTVPAVNTIVDTTWIAWSGVELRDEDGLEPGFYVAATGPDGWAGASIYYSSDGGTTWLFGGNVTDRTEIGITTSTLADGTTPDAWDLTHTVGVALSVTGSLSTTSQTDVEQTTNNNALVGEEVLGYATATLTSALNYTLSTLYRGRRASMMTGHTTGERFVHLTEALVRVKLPADLAGATLDVKLTSPGQALVDVTAQTITIANNVYPYVPAGDPRLIRRATVCFCDAFTPGATGGDSSEYTLPPIDGAVVTWTCTEIRFSVVTPGGAPAVTIEKSAATGAFSPTSIGSLALASGATEGRQNASLGTVDSRQKIRMNPTALGTAQLWTLEADFQVNP
jgi:hypothetical protein